MSNSIKDKFIFYITVILSGILGIWVLAGSIGAAPFENPIAYIIANMPIISWACGLLLAWLMENKVSPKIFYKVFYMVVALIAICLSLPSFISWLKSEFCLSTKYYEFTKLCEFSHQLSKEGFTISFYFLTIILFGLGFSFRGLIKRVKV